MNDWTNEWMNAAVRSFNERNGQRRRTLATTMTSASSVPGSTGGRRASKLSRASFTFDCTKKQQNDEHRFLVKQLSHPLRLAQAQVCMLSPSLRQQPFHCIGYSSEFLMIHQSRRKWENGEQCFPRPITGSEVVFPAGSGVEPENGVWCILSF